MSDYTSFSSFLLVLLLLAVPAKAQISPGSCASTGTATAQIDVNNVRATIPNNGNLFYPGTGAPYYEVPKGSGLSSVFASGIWIGGMAGDELRLAAAQYENFEFRPGPLNDQGLPVECNGRFDHVWKVSKVDIQRYDATGQATPDLQNWPADAGAPVIDGDGNPDNYNLSGGDRPKLIGDQALWWVMNDVAPPHNETQSPPIGLEAQVQAFAFNQAGALGNTTFYKYKFKYKGDQVLKDVYLGLWADTDLGDAGDDYVGSDPDLGLGFTYNGSPSDPNYGNPAPALGYDFFQGPLVAAPGSTQVDPDGTIHEDSTRLAMERFVYYNNVNGSPTGNPADAEDYYGYLRGVWPDGQPITVGGTGRDPSAPRAEFMYPADPPNFWSESQPTPGGDPNSASDRRFLQSSGPFTLRPGDTQTVVFGIVWARVGSSGETANIASLEKLKNQDALAQQVFDINFTVPSPPDAPNVEATPRNQAVTLTWGYTPQQNNYLGQYRAENTLIPSVPKEDRFYKFEGFIIKRFSSPSDGEGRIVAIYDKKDGITRVLDESDPGGTVTVDIEGTDSGLKYSYQATGLTNYKKYYFGVQPYAYNAESTPKIYRGPTARVTVQPSKPTAGRGGSTLISDSLGTVQKPDSIIQAGGGSVTAEVVNPDAITGDTYRVEFRRKTVYSADSSSTRSFTVYDVFNERTGEKVFDADEFVDFSCNRTGEFKLSECEAPPQTEDAFQAEGLSFNVQGPEPDFVDIVEVVGDQTGSFYSGGLALNPSGSSPRFFVTNTNGNGATFTGSGIDRFGVIGNGAPRDIEIRFVENPEENGQIVFNYFKAPGRTFNLMKGWTEINADGDTTKHATGRVPFQVWHVRPDGTEKQVEASVYSTNNDRFWDPTSIFDIITAADAPVAYEPIYASNIPYDEDAINSDPAGAFEEWAAGFPSRYTINRLLFDMYFGVKSPPAPGTTVRFVTTKPNLPGDQFTLNTDQLAPTRDSTELARENLDDIAIVPNPYKGVSDYEVSQIVDVVKFINMPDQATVRIYTLSGRLIRTLRKNNSSRQMTWDLQTGSDLPIASGMYLIHVDVPDVGERILKFGVVKKTPKLNEL